MSLRLREKKIISHPPPKFFWLFLYKTTYPI